MKKTVVISMLVACAVLLLLLPAYSQEDEIVLGGEADGFEMSQRPAVAFSHTDHMDYEGVDGCSPCHHDGMEDGQFIESEDYETKCADCHADGPTNGLDPLTQSFHMQCQSCHETTGKGPLTCGECHVQKDFFGMPMGGEEVEEVEVEVEEVAE